MNTGKLLTVALLVLSAGGGFLFAQQCPQCPPEIVSRHPFELSHQDYSPVTYGLPAGSPAPAILGVELEGYRTILTVINTYDSPFVPALTRFSNTDAQLVVVAHNLGSDALSELQATLAGEVTLIADPDAFLMCALYRVGPNPVVSPLTFLIDERGVIVYRRFGVKWLAYRKEEEAVRHFLAHGALPSGFLPQHVLWEGDSVPWPPFPLLNLNGEEAYLGPGSPLFLLKANTSPSSERGQLLFQVMDALREEFPQVRFVWLVNKFSAEHAANLWRLYTQLGLEHQLPEEYRGLSQEEWVEKSQREQGEMFNALLEDLRLNAPGWQVLMEEDLQLSVFWGLRVSPSVQIVNQEGQVALPHTSFGYYRLPGSDEVFLHPSLGDALREAIQAALR